MPKKFQENYIKNQRQGTFRNNQERTGGPPPGDQEGPWRGLGWGRASCPPGWLVVALLRFFGDSGSFCCADFLSNFSGVFRHADFLYIFFGIFGALLMAGKPEIQKQQLAAGCTRLID